MAGDAERHQITLVMCATVRERFDVMHERCTNISLTLFAHLTEQVSRQVSVADSAPYATISGVLIVPTREVVIVSLHDFLVRLTVTAFSIRKVRTACHAAGTFRLSRHHFTSIAA